MDVREALLQAVCAGIRGTQVQWTEEVTARDWSALAELAQEQQVLPMVLQGCYNAPAFLSQSDDVRTALLRRSRMQVAGQTMRSHALAELWRELRGAGFTPVIMKGAACRSVYPVSAVRISSDEDVLVPAEQFRACTDFLRSRGFTGGEGEDGFEVGLRRSDGLYIELHSMPFAPDDPVLGGCNAAFAGLHDRCITIDADGAALQVMGAQDHMRLLILHAFKHLLFSGFGLRQVCDMVLWAERYGREIDWEKIAEDCIAVRALGFVRAVFQIGVQHLEMDTAKADLAPSLLLDDGTAEALLEDLLGGGVFGTATRSRTHSANLTRSAVAAQRQGEKPSLRRTLFPPRKALEKDYPYLKKQPWLLGAAWLTRLTRYGAEVLRRSDSDAAEALRIGRERTELLRKLDILD